ncbi:hypothetical protein Y1Q_0016086 [Alligator mississippiensis]|uniref:Uncharacterized protein n=1 Tax=Alligator mississippiensis TaxID=8496 RepID=A0A151P172_ALLMI|nr:hypothetical protein Y1Q_0016086 [Alligator mississippiensis]
MSGTKLVHGPEEWYKAASMGWIGLTDPSFCMLDPVHMATILAGVGLCLMALVRSLICHRMWNSKGNLVNLPEKRCVISAENEMNSTPEMSFRGLLS